MGCCSSCDSGGECAASCCGARPEGRVFSDCANGACNVPQPAQYYVPNFFPAPSCAPGGACGLPAYSAPMPSYPMPDYPLIGSPGTGAIAPETWRQYGAARHAYEASQVPLPPPGVPLSQTTFWAEVNAAGARGMNLREAPSPNAPLSSANVPISGGAPGAAPNGTLLYVLQTGIPEIGAPSGSPIEWWKVVFAEPAPTQSARPRGFPFSPAVVQALLQQPEFYVRAVGPMGERNLAPTNRRPNA